MKIKDVMHSGVEWVSPDAPIAAVATRMRDHNVGAIPVAEDGQLVGMITDRDVTVRAVAEGRDLAELSARDVMSTGVVSCRDTDEVEDAVRLMDSKQVRRLPVLNQDGDMVGMLSVVDIPQGRLREVSRTVLQPVSPHFF
jgi:predicted transcriptional regulator